MFWTITLVVVAFVAVTAWAGRRRGTARSRSSGDLTEATRRAKWTSQGEVDWYH